MGRVLHFAVLCALTVLARATSDARNGMRMAISDFEVVYDPLRNVHIERRQHKTETGEIVYESDLRPDPVGLLNITGAPLPLQGSGSNNDVQVGRRSLVAGVDVTISGTGSTFKITYANDNLAPTSVRPAIEQAFQIWANEWQSSVEMRVLVNWAVLSGDTLGFAGSYFTVQSKACMLNSYNLVQNLVYNPNLLASMNGFDFVPATEYHIEMSLDSQTDWFLGTTTEVDSASSQYDLVTVVLHEVCHGLFFADSTFVDVPNELASFAHPEYGNGGPSRFDSFLVDETDSKSLISKCSDPAGFFDSLTGDNLYFHNQDPTAPQTRFKIYSPTTYDGGSSTGHFDTLTWNTDCTANGIASADCSDLMTPSVTNGYSQRSIGENTRRVLAALKGSYSAFSGKCVIDPWDYPPSPPPQP